ncbi:hypothetical protein CNYM01_10719 [Colletotrichum nymphaeae SA-01]|uniref:Uncharacterized protein n=1 Tax=Colletotrichum nymphaeae SA-01 TaxID=1460502 RepID=A0A135U880_9PEZI|nr:hypothetical protein CNYM01_10719 [Colletotrichum nymphaeae SA-01]
MANLTTANRTAEVSDLTKFEGSLKHYYLPFGYIAFVNTAIDLYICCMLLVEKSPLNPARRLQWKKIICAYFAITWVATPFLMVFIQLPRTDSRAMRDLMKGSTMTVVINHWMIFVALLILFFSKEKNNETMEGSEAEVVRDEIIERGPEALCRLSVNAEPSTSIDAVTEVDYNFEDHTEKATLLSEFIRDSSPTQIEPNKDSEGSGISVTPPKESAADTLISLLDHSTQRAMRCSGTPWIS